MGYFYYNWSVPQPVIPDLLQVYLFRGQTALVTGVDSGIVRAIALALGGAGANVVINQITDPEQAMRREVCRRLAGRGGTILYDQRHRLVGQRGASNHSPESRV